MVLAVRCLWEVIFFSQLLIFVVFPSTTSQELRDGKDSTLQSLPCPAALAQWGYSVVFNNTADLIHWLNRTFWTLLVLLTQRWNDTSFWGGSCPILDGGYHLRSWAIQDGSPLFSHQLILHASNHTHPQKKIVKKGLKEFKTVKTQTG